MYHPEIIEESLERAQKRLKTPITRLTPEDSQALAADLAEIYDPETCELTQPLTDDQQASIQSELALCKFDFRYFHDHYVYMARDAATGKSGVGISNLWESQENLLAVISEAYIASIRAYREGIPTMGVRIADHKSRQLGHTHVCRALSNHRLLFYRGTRALGASLNDDMLKELWDRDELILKYLPWYLSPPMSSDEFYRNQNKFMHWKSMDCRIVYEQANQSGGLGQGRQVEVSHLTECAAWPYPRIITLDFVPTLPDHYSTLTVFESTAQGRGNWWHDFTESVRRGDQVGFRYVFTPWYMEPKKYRLQPPEGWEPTEHTKAHAELVESSSPEFCRGKTIRLGPQQLYWYERKYESAREEGTLNLYLTNYAAIPEESFQFTTEGILPFEVLDRLRQRARPGVPYEPNFIQKIMDR